MKPYLSYILIFFAMLGLFLVYSIDVVWSGLFASLHACICLSFAIYFTRYMK